MKKNHVALGVDGMTIEEAKDRLKANWPALVETIKKELLHREPSS